MSACLARAGLALQDGATSALLLPGDEGDALLFAGDGSLAAERVGDAP